jgi:hypothetical protein
MCGRASVLRVLVTASVMCAFTAPASAAGMGGMSMGGMAVGMTAVAGLGGVASAAGVAGAANTYNASAPGSGDHIPIGASDGPSGLSASSGHNPFGNSKASSAWASLPAMDPDLPGVVAPGLPSLAQSGPSAPEVNVQGPVTAERQSKSLDVNSGSQGGSGALLQSSLSSSEAPSALRR